MARITTLEGDGDELDGFATRGIQKAMQKASALAQGARSAPSRPAPRHVGGFGAKGIQKARTIAAAEGFRVPIDLQGGRRSPGLMPQGGGYQQRSPAPARRSVGRAMGPQVLKRVHGAQRRAGSPVGQPAYFGDDSELLGFSIGKALKKGTKVVAKATKAVAKPVASVAKAVAKPVASVAVKAAQVVAKPVASAAVSTAKAVAKPGGMLLNTLVAKPTSLLKDVTVSAVKGTGHVAATVARGTAKLAAKNPTATLLMTGGTGAALLATTKKGRAGMGKAVGNALVAATVVPTGGLSLLAKKNVRKTVGKAAVGAAKFAARHPTATMLATGGAGAAVLATTKKGRSGLKNFTGNALVAATAVPTGGLSLLGKKSVRDFAKRHPYMAAAVNPASLLYTGATKRGRHELAAPVRVAERAVEAVADAFSPSPSGGGSAPAAPVEKPADFSEAKPATPDEGKSGILPYALAAGVGALMLL